MTGSNLTQDEIKNICKLQKAEIEGFESYNKLAELEKDEHNKNILIKMANEEWKHYEVLKSYTNIDVKASKFKVTVLSFMVRVFGLTFGLKFMENTEDKAIDSYEPYMEKIPQIAGIIKDENGHEDELIELINEEKLNYMGSVVLGLNDALVELTGALVGFTFALQNSKLIALIGLITGISAALSMAASEYLSTKAEGNAENALKASTYTGIAYIFTVAFLVLPYEIFSNVYVSLSVSLGIVVLIIASFNYYYAVVKNESFRPRFIEMTALSFGVSFVSFVIGLALKHYTGIDL